jgi:exonuclease III
MYHMYIVFDISNITFGNIYLQSGTDGLSKGQRENYISETLPQLLLNRKDSGVVGGDFNCITKAEDSINNPESKMSPSLKRVIQTFNFKDSYHCLYPTQKAFSRYYNINGQDGATRIDRSYNWGDVSTVSAWYESVAFSDH